MAKRPPWYAEGLRFACQPDCGRCCSRHDEYAYVYLSEEDACALAAHLHLTDEQFRARFTAIDDGDLVLTMGEAACAFLDGARCTVYRARPRQCGTFPFWPENLKSLEAWNDLSTFCPGVGKGDFVPLHAIRTHLRGRQS